MGQHCPASRGRARRPIAIANAGITRIIGAAAPFGWSITWEDIPRAVAAAIFDISRTQWVVLLLINVSLLVAATFMEGIAILTVLMPVLRELAIQIEQSGGAARQPRVSARPVGHRRATIPAVPELTIRPLAPADRDPALAVINAAARWYREFLAPDEVHEPEMTPAQWEAEAGRMTWYGAFLQEALVGVMGLEYVSDVALLRHGYVLPEHQHRGIGSCLHEHLETQVRGVRRIVVGTYAGNYKAQAALEKAGYRLSPDPAAALRAYYAIPEERLRSSVTYEKDL